MLVRDNLLVPAMLHSAQPNDFEMQFLHFGTPIRSSEVKARIESMKGKWRAACAGQMIRFYQNAGQKHREDYRLLVFLGTSILHGNFNRVPVLFLRGPGSREEDVLDTSFECTIWGANAAFALMRDADAL